MTKKGGSAAGEGGRGRTEEGVKGEWKRIEERERETGVRELKCVHVAVLLGMTGLFGRGEEVPRPEEEQTVNERQNEPRWKQERRSGESERIEGAHLHSGELQRKEELRASTQEQHHHSLQQETKRGEQEEQEEEKPQRLAEEAEGAGRRMRAAAVLCPAFSERARAFAAGTGGV